MGKTCCNYTKISRRHGGYITQHQGIPCGLPDTNTAQDFQRTKKRVSNQDSSMNKCKCSTCGIEPQSRTAGTPRTHSYIRGLHGPNGPYFYPSTQPWKSPLNDGYRRRIINWYQKFPPK